MNSLIFFTFQTISIWLVNFGVKAACQLIYYHPGYFLLGIFSPFMVSGEVHNEGRSEQNGENAKGQQGTIGALLGAHGAIGQPFALETCATGAAEAAS